MPIFSRYFRILQLETKHTDVHDKYAGVKEEKKRRKKNWMPGTISLKLILHNWIYIYLFLHFYFHLMSFTSSSVFFSMLLVTRNNAYSLIQSFASCVHFISIFFFLSLSFHLIIHSVHFVSFGLWEIDRRLNFILWSVCIRSFLKSACLRLVAFTNSPNMAIFILLSLCVCLLLICISNSHVFDSIFFYFVCGSWISFSLEFIPISCLIVGFEYDFLLFFFHHLLISLQPIFFYQI